MPRPILAAALLLAACNAAPILPDNAGMARDPGGAEPLDPGTRPVRIGESGPAFDACAMRGMVVNAGAAGLPVRTAPFGEAETAATLADGTRLFVCTRSIDQRWLGVVVPPVGAEGDPCGMSVRLAEPRDYAGPCTSGWVGSAFVRLIDG